MPWEKLDASDLGFDVVLAECLIEHEIADLGPESCFLFSIAIEVEADAKLSAICQQAALHLFGKYGKPLQTNSYD